MNEKAYLEKINLLKRDFLFFNVQRLYHMLSYLEEESGKIFEAIPFLIHTNLKEYPGFIEPYANSYGIETFVPDCLKISYIRKELFNLPPTTTFNYHPKKGSIKSLFLMGSLGSIAQTEKSDFDYWIIVDDSETDKNLIRYLLSKCTLIEEWANEKAGMEVHFFIMTLQQVQKNNFGEACGESAGSSMVHLLKEEFYRSSILTAGKIPFFWITPTGCNDEEYDESIKLTKRNIPEICNDFIDLGNLYAISTQEFYGALLWQIYKYTDSPFKSAIKMGLLHYYFFNPAPSSLLCNSLKSKIGLNGSNDIKNDSYLLMFDAVESFYSSKKDAVALDTIRKSLLLKLETTISNDDFLELSSKYSERERYKKNIIIAYLKKWDFSYDEYLTYSDKNRITFSNNMKLGKQIYDFMLNAYKSVSDLLIGYGEAVKITEKDLTVLGKKIISKISHKKNKVNILPLCVKTKTILKDITILRSEQHAPVWSLYYGNINKNFLSSQQLNEYLLLNSKSIVELIAFLVYNNLVGKDTSIHIMVSCLANSDKKEIRTLIEYLELFFSQSYSPKMQEDRFYQEEFIARICYILNFNVLSNGENDFKVVSIIYQNSLGELFFREFTGLDIIKESTTLLTMNRPKQINQFSEYFQVYCGPGLWSFFQKLSLTNSLNAALVNEIGDRRKGSRSKLDIGESDKILDYFTDKRIANLKRKLDI